MSERVVAGLRTRFWDYAPANQLLDAATPPTPASLAPEQVAVGERAQDRQRRLFGAAIRANPALDPRAPAESPVVLAMLAWARREITKSFLDQMPIPNFEQSTENEPVPNTETPPVEEAGAVPSTRLFTGDYDTGDFSDWRWMHNAYYDGTGTDNPQTSYAARVVDDPERGKVARYELRSGDIAVGDNERTEVVGPIVGREGETGWYALSFKFDPEFPMDHASQGWGVVSQFHTETDGSPPLSITVDRRDGYWSVAVHEFSAPGNLVDTFSIYDAPLNPGEWQDVKLEVRWSASGEVGYVRVWKDGVLQTLIGPAEGEQTYRGPTLTPGGGTVYYKEGYYRQPMSETGVVYHDGFRYASTEDGL